MWIWNRRYNRGIALLIVLTFVFSIAGQSTWEQNPVSAAETRITEGNYTYSCLPDDSNLGASGYDVLQGQNALLPFDGGLLTDGNHNSYAAWKGNGTGTSDTVEIIFDLKKDYPLEQIKVISNTPDTWHGVYSVKVKCRAEAETKYTVYASQSWYGTSIQLPDSVEKNNSLLVNTQNNTARYVIVEIKKCNTWANLLLSEVEIYKGTGNVSNEPGTAKTAAELLQETEKPESVYRIPEPGLIMDGNYIYDHAPDTSHLYENGYDVGQTGLISFADGLLTDVSTQTYAGWSNNYTQGTTVTLVYDLLKDYPLDRIKIISNAPNEYWGIYNIKVKYRSESEANYWIIGSGNWYGTSIQLPDTTDWNNTLTYNIGNQQARYIIVEISKCNQWQNMPLTEVQFYQGTGETGTDPAPVKTAAELLAESNLPAKAIRTAQPGQIMEGNYLYNHAPDGGGRPDQLSLGLIAFDEGLLTDGNETTYAKWQASGTSPWDISIVYDLQKDYPLELINVISNAPDAWNGVSYITVKYRAEEDSRYKILYAGDWYGSKIDTSTMKLLDGVPLNNTLELDAGGNMARFVIVNIIKANPWQNMPLTEVEFFQAAGQEEGEPGAPYTLENLQAEFNKGTLTVDKYGQYYYEDWTGKITSDEDLQEDYAQEAQELAEVSLDTETYDQYGGILSGGTYASTGYFRLLKTDGKWWFITPDGHKFFMKGVDNFNLDDPGYTTVYKNADGSIRDLFEELPDPLIYGDAYSTAFGYGVSFIKANIMKKYGADYEAKWAEITQKRLIDWGFNAHGKWGKSDKITMPYVAMLEMPQDAIKLQWTEDTFDPDFQLKVENKNKQKLLALKNDPNLIGYIFSNEEGWTTEIVEEVLLLDSSSYAKSAFVNMMAQKYGNINAVNQKLGTTAASLEDLKALPITSEQVPAEDIAAFIRLASQKYYSSVYNVIKKYDTNHLFLGSASTPGWRSCLEWETGGLNYIDAITLDTYTDSADYLKLYEPYDKPVLNVEFSFNYSGRGLRSLNSSITCSTIEERGQKTAAFLEAQAKSPVFVGYGYFMYYDDPVTGTMGGETCNFGLVNGQDQPYTEMVDILRVANAGLEAVHDLGTGRTELTEEGTAGDNGVSNPVGEEEAKAFDNNINTKWVTYTSYGVIQYDFAGDTAYAISSYSITSANDVPERDPKNWELQGSNDGISWISLDSRSDMVFTERHQTVSFSFTNATPYRMYRLNITAAYGNSALQLAEIQLFANPEVDLTEGGSASDYGLSNPEGEDETKAFDNNTATKWLPYASAGKLSYDFNGTDAYIVNRYSVSSANDVPGRDPKSWTFEGSNDGIVWTVLDTRVNMTFPNRYQTEVFDFTNSTSYQMYRLNITANHGEGALQLSELQMFTR